MSVEQIGEVGMEPRQSRTSLDMREWSIAIPVWNLSLPTWACMPTQKGVHLWALHRVDPQKGSIVNAPMQWLRWILLIIRPEENRLHDGPDFAVCPVLAQDISRVH